MILPTKHLSSDVALLSVGARILRCLPRETTVSRLWNEVRKATREEGYAPALSFDWFILALDLLFLLGAVELSEGRLRRVAR